MKPRASLLLWIGLALAAAFATQACGAASGGQKNGGGAGSDPAGATRAAAPSGQDIPAKNAVLPDASAGLADLKAYHAVLEIEAAGSLDGQPFTRSTRVEITRASSGDFDSLVQTGGGKAAARLLALGGAYYRWSGATPACEGSADPPGEDEVIEPAALLPPLGAASRVGVETVNQVSAVHYRFDPAALPHFKPAGKAEGDVWVAEEGGYVLRYQLSAAAPQKPSGKGLEVSQSYRYELSPGGPGPALPKGCAAVPVDLPAADGARNLNRAGGVVTFDTAAKPREVIDFYEQKLPGLGWKAESAGPAGEIALPAFFDFSKGGLRLTVNLTANEDQTTAVALTVADAAAQAAEPPPPTPTPAEAAQPLPTIDPAQSGLPPNVPLYPGATNLLQAGGAVMFQSGDGWEVVASYYRKQLAELGWTAESEQALESGVSMTWNQDGKMLILTILAQDSQTQIVVSLPQ